jgi:hypothetical protein
MSELRVDNIVSQDGSTAPTYSKGIRISAGQTMTNEGDYTVSGTSTFSGNVVVNGGSINVTGATVSVENVSASGVVTATGGFVGNLTGTATAASSLSGTPNISVGVVTTTALHLGAEGSAIRVTSNTISGPAEMYIDPAAVGDNTGAIRIKGDLYVDGTQTVINSTTLDVADYNVGIATTVTTNIALDGAGLGIGAPSIRKTFNYNNTANTLESSIGLGVTAGGSFKTGSTTVLDQTTLGATVVNSSLTSIGTLTNLNVSGVSTLGTIYGDGSNITNPPPVDGQDFNTGITSALSATLTGIGTTVLTLPATSGKQYIVYSIHASNVATGNTEVNVIGAFDYNGGERTYFGYNIPIPTGTAVEMLKQPHILNPSDRITMRSTDYDRVGIDTGVEVYITYQERTSSNYFGVGLGTVGIGLTTPIGIHTATTYPSIIESINLVNRTDTGAYPVSITVTSGVVTTYLVDNLMIPKYGAVEILDAPKRLNVNDVLSIQVDQTGTIDVQVSGKKVV